MNNHTNPIAAVESAIANFFRLETAAGIVLLVAAVLAIVIANSPFDHYYNLLQEVPVEIRIADFQIAKPLLLWINDGLMAIFFFFVGLELKRELIEGELSSLDKIALPAVAAIGGMVVPALIYYVFNSDNAVATQGWAIPTATDIAFALGILMLLGSRVPTSIKVFLTSLAIFDDIGAIVVIAVFYTANISIDSLLVVLFCLPVLAFLNWRGVIAKSVYIAIGLIMWSAMLKSGVHATLTGVILAMFIPLRSDKDKSSSPLEEMERDLHSVVAFMILPLFAFVNAGLDFRSMGIEQLLHPVSIGIALGLFLGKQIGIFGFCWAAVKLRLVKLPDEMTWATLYGVAALCGIGFTMSLFIGSLAFEETSVNLLFDERLGILVGSFASGILGYIVLKFSLKKPVQE